MNESINSIGNAGIVEGDKEGITQGYHVSTG